MQLGCTVARRRSHMRLLAAVCTAAVFACSEYLGPERGDPADYVIDGVEYSCDLWSPEEPEVEYGLFDVLWPRGDVNDSHDEPSASQRQTILDAGGTIVHTFNVPMIRAILPVAAIPEAFWGPISVTGVPDADEFPVAVFVGFYASDLSDIASVIESFDGVVHSVSAFTRAASATVPDESIPGLRDHPLTAYVQSFGAGSCEPDASKHFGRSFDR